MNLGTAVGYLELDTSKFQSGLKTAQSQFKGFMDTSQSASDRFIGLGNSMKTVGSNLSKYVTLPLAGIGAAAVKTTTDFQAGMSEVQAISGATGKDLELLTEKAKEMGSTTKFSASDSADALKYMAMAGWKTQDMLKGLPAILNLAAAGGTDLAVTSDIVTDGMTAMGISIDDAGGFVDIMAATCSNANTNIELMGETLKYVGPVAGALGISMDDLSLAIGLMGKAGLKGSQAGTSLRAGLTNLIKPTEQMEKAMKKYGVEVVKTGSGSVDFLGTMENLRSTLGGLDETTQAAALSTIFGKEAMSGWASIVNASEADFNKLSDAILESAGSAEKMSATMQDNLKGSIDNMKSAFEGFLIVIGERLTPIIRDVVDNISKMFAWFNNLNPVVQNVVIAFGGLLASVGPLLLIFGNLIIFAVNLGTAIGTLTTFFSAAGAGAGILSVAIGALSGPIGITIAAITALIAIGTLLYKNWDEIKAKASAMWDSIKNTVSNACEGIKEVASNIWQGIEEATSIAWDGVTKAIDSAFTTACNLLGADAELIKTTLSETWTNIKNDITVAWEGISGIIKDSWNIVKDTVNEGVNNLKTVLSEAWEPIKENVSLAWDVIKNTIGTAWNNIKEVIGDSVGAIFETIASAWEEIKTTLSMFGDVINELIEGDWEGAKEIVREMNDKIKDIISKAWDKIKSILSEMGASIKDIMSKAWDNIKSTISIAIDNIKNIVSSGWNKVKDTVKNIGRDIADYTKFAWEDVKSAISRAVDNIKSSAKQGWDKMKGDVQTAWNNIKQIVKTIATGIAGDIGDQLKKAWETAKGWWDKIKAIFANPIKAVVNVFKNEGKAIPAPQADTSLYARNNVMDVAKEMTYARNASDASISRSIESTLSLSDNLLKRNVAKGSSSNNVTINNTYNSPKPASIRELKRQDEIQMRRLAMQLGF